MACRQVTGTSFRSIDQCGMSTVVHASDCASLLLYISLYGVEVKCQDSQAAIEEPGRSRSD